jgi:sugar phosphate isomerase/epimerase
MLIGAMNHPQEDVLDEIRWMVDMGLEFIDLTLEPPAAASWEVDPIAIRRAIDDAGFEAVGHTAYYLPLASPFEAIRKAAIDELKRCIDIFDQVGVKWMNIHPDGHAPMHSRAYIIERNLQSLRELQEHCGQTGVGLMIENLPGSFNTVHELGELLDEMPELGLHLDIGHCNLRVRQNTAPDLIRAYGDRLKHVHLHDNKGGSADLHLPLGSGSLDVEGCVRELRQCGYDGTIALEVFSPDRHYLAYSRDVLREMWDKMADLAPAKREKEPAVRD